MARVLFGTVPGWGHINPTIAVAQQLQEQGHTVAYVCHPEVGPALERAGLELLDGFRHHTDLGSLRVGDLERVGLELLDDLCHSSPISLMKEAGIQYERLQAIIRGIGRSPTGFYFDDLDRNMDELVKVVQAWQPDVLVCDLRFHPGAIAAEACRLPYATSCPEVPPWPSSALPPYGVGLSPRARPDWRQHLARAVRHWIVHSGDRAVNRVRRRYHLPPIRGAFIYPSPYLVLTFSAEAYEYPRPDVPPQVWLIGPSISQRRGDADFPFPWEWLDGRPTVYVSLGTQDVGPAQFYDRAIEASRGQPWQTVISLGRHLDLSRWTDLPENVLLRNHVPHLELLRQVQVMISHGGHNTVIEAILAGVPLGVAPIGGDQYENAQRVVEAGAGLRLRLSKVKANELRDAIRRLLEEPDYRGNAQRIARDLARCDGPSAAAMLIQRLAEKRAPVLRPDGRSPTIYANEIAEIQ
jgi:zeaxanthin glucosyltransferase